ncbi:hypothetical protein LY632_03565 [Erythrobacter sp. SDW2]|uniref:hypothetical protein n=1 Tax=Erythrobacter sp. SDW2 TaxID=2907154 RepID=UPI001F3FC7AA|nr:hypothetical protein [Erythrobacter sp. SDW2]UIP07488.1 hypothetical protein LY632_03565 [Erythrobacter sp. SDW2]
MTLLVILTLGMALGWLAAILLRHDSFRQSFADIVTGALGSLGGYLVAGGRPDSHAIGFELLMLGALGAGLLLAAVAFLRRQTAR